MNEGGSRRAVAEIRFGEDRIGITKVGGRSIHQYWTLLGPHFRDVLLAPQRRSDDGGVGWTWREAADKKPLTPSELASVRKRLERANESFAENPVNPLMGDARSGTSSQALIDQIATKVKAMAQTLSAKSDAALADFVCRTETGVMVHSWGVASPAQVVYPDSLETGISGVVMIGGKPSEGHEVVIENSKGLSVARMQSDESGEFHFSKIGPGRYRVRVVSGKVKFPAKGAMVTVERGAVSRLELPSTADSNEQGDSGTTPPLTPSTETSTGSMESTPPLKRGGRDWIGKTMGVLLLLMLLVGGGVWAWQKWSTSDATEKRVTVRNSSMAPEAFNAGENEAHIGNPSGRSVGDGGGLGVSADGIGGESHRPASRPGATTDRRATATTTARGNSPSTIGSKVDVLSGVAVARGTDVKNADAAFMQPPASNEVTGQESVADQAGSVPDAGVRTGTPAPKINSGTAATGPSLPGTAPTGSDAQPSHTDADADENTKRLRGVKNAEGIVSVPAIKKPAKAQVQGVVSVGKQSADGAMPQDEVVIPGAAPEDSPSEEVAVHKSGIGLPLAKAPTAKVSVVRKGVSEKKPMPAGDAFDSDSAAAEEGKDAPAPDNAKTKRGKNSTSRAGAKAPADGVPADGDGSASPPLEQNEAVTPAPPNERSQTAESPDLASDRAANNSLAGNLTGSSGSSLAARKADGLVSAVRKTSASHALSKRSGGALVKQPTENDQKTQQVETQKSVSSDPDKTTAPEQTPAANPMATVSAGGEAQVSEIQSARWEPRLLRDAVVPTLPVRVGDDDAADLVRGKMLSEQKARMPVAFRHPVTQRGYVFELPEAPSARAFHWQDSPETGMIKRTAAGNCAEITWPGEALPSGSVQVLLFADGHEAVRLAVNEKGNLVLKVAKGVRCSLSLVLKRSIVDESGLAKSELGPRFGWQVNGVARNSAQQTEKFAPINPDERIDIPLALDKGIRIDVALTDRVTGWALVTNIQLQPAP